LTTRVLIVDDDVPTRVGLVTILSGESDIEVVGEAANGRDACTLAIDLEPDVVLMDVQLPELDGIEATRLITANTTRTKTPRVIVLTTFDLDEYAYKSLRVGASGFLLKRTRAEDLIDAVRVVAEGEELPMPATTRRLIANLSAQQSAHEREWRAIDDLTDREQQVLVFIARGYSNQEIAGELTLSVDTVKTHVKRVYAKLGARDRVHAVIAAYESGLVTRRSD
jgi:DNA-binding NarL/FixJ family response regulator